MKKFFKDNPQRLFFWMGFAVVVILVLTGVGYTIYKMKTAKTEETKTEESNTPSPEDYKKVATTWGNIVTVSDSEIQIKDNAGKTAKFVINSNTSINQGESMKVIKVSNLKAGEQVTVSYTIDGLKALNIYKEGVENE